jgi:LPS sulfotransferase NodH
VRYLIASTQRTGGLLLCELLTQAGAGCPGEYLHRAHPVPDGPVFGIKVQYDELAGVDRYGPYDRAVHLVRRDTDAQALSWARAEASNQWQRRPGEPKVDAEVSGTEVCRIAEAIPAQNRAWRAWLRDRSIPTITVAYEQLTRDPDATVDRILAHLGLPAHTSPLTASTVKQAA